MVALPADSRVSVAGRLRVAGSALGHYVAGAPLDRRPVAEAVVFLELEMRGLRRGREGESAERERLWVEIDAIADAL